MKSNISYHAKKRCNNKCIFSTYFLGSERSEDSFLDFANCSTEGGARLLPGADWAHSRSAYEWAVALEHPVALLKLDVLCSRYSPPPTQKYAPCIRSSYLWLETMSRNNQVKCRMRDIKFKVTLNVLFPLTGSSHAEWITCLVETLYLKTTEWNI